MVWQVCKNNGKCVCVYSHGRYAVQKGVKECMQEIASIFNKEELTKALLSETMNDQHLKYSIDQVGDLSI